MNVGWQFAFVRHAFTCKENTLSTKVWQPQNIIVVLKKPRVLMVKAQRSDDKKWFGVASGVAEKHNSEATHNLEYK